MPRWNGDPNSLIDECIAMYEDGADQREIEEHLRYEGVPDNDIDEIIIKVLAAAVADAYLGAQQDANGPTTVQGARDALASALAADPEQAAFGVAVESAARLLRRALLEGEALPESNLLIGAAAALEVGARDGNVVTLAAGRRLLGLADEIDWQGSGSKVSGAQSVPASAAPNVPEAAKQPELVPAIRRHWPVLLMAVVIAGGIGWVLAEQRTSESGGSAMAIDSGALGTYVSDMAQWWNALGVGLDISWLPDAIDRDRVLDAYFNPDPDADLPEISRPAFGPESWALAELHSAMIGVVFQWAIADDNADWESLRAGVAAAFCEPQDSGLTSWEILNAEDLQLWREAEQDCEDRERWAGRLTGPQEIQDRFSWGCGVRDLGLFDVYSSELEAACSAAAVLGELVRLSAGAWSAELMRLCGASALQRISATPGEAMLFCFGLSGSNADSNAGE